jgi:hypothetical protein
MASPQSDFPMVQNIRVISQGFHGKNGIFFSPDNHPHIPADFVSLIKKPLPIYLGGAVPPICEQDRPENAIGILRRFPDFV